jgi:hypothetical protein
MREDKNMGIMITLKKPTLERAWSPRGARRKRRLRRSRRARPNIWRFNILRRLICPSTGLVLQGKVTPALTA